jgi:hypothetical protein
MGRSVAAPMMAAAIKNLPPMMGVSSMTGGVRALTLALALDLALCALGSVAPARGGGALLGLSLSLMTAA